MSFCKLNVNRFFLRDIVLILPQLQTLFQTRAQTDILQNLLENLKSFIIVRSHKLNVSRVKKREPTFGPWSIRFFLIVNLIKHVTYYTCFKVNYLKHACINALYFTLFSK